MKRSYQLKNNRTGEDIPQFQTEVVVTLTKTHLTFEFDCKNSMLYSATDIYNGPVFDGDACEAFICTDGSRKFYYEFEVAPNNTVFINKIINNGVGIIETIPIDENFLISSVEINGNDYKVKFSIPLDKIDFNKDVGILYNIFRIETEGGITDKNLLSANPTLNDTFHDSSFFFELK